MGYYHINDTGKGVIIKDFDNISKDYKIPPIDYIKEYFESKRGIGKKNLEWLASMDVYHQLAYLAQNDYRLSYIVSNLNEKTPEAFCKKYDESYSDDFSSDAANIFECLFCYRFGYPFGYFKGISDYDGTIMFFCNAQYPPKTYNKKFGELTEAISSKNSESFSMSFLKTIIIKQLNLNYVKNTLRSKGSHFII